MSLKERIIVVNLGVGVGAARQCNCPNFVDELSVVVNQNKAK